MTTRSASDLTSKAQVMGEWGDALIAAGQVTTAAGDDTQGDIFRMCTIPAGTEVHAIVIANEDLDSGGGPSLTVDIGYTPVNSDDGPTADDDGFLNGGAASDVLQSANAGKVFAGFDPIKFEYDVYLDLTVANAAAAFVTDKKIWAKVLGRCVGIK